MSPKQQSEYVTREELNARLAALEKVSANGQPAHSAAIGARIRNSPWLNAAAIGGMIAVFMIAITWPGLIVGFDGDDVTNLHQAWHPPVGELVLSNLVPFTTFYRPIGSLYYRLCFALFGWHPHMFRFVTYGLMLANLLLVYLVAKRVTKSGEIGALSALLYCFHGRMRGLYVSNGAVYDVLCTTFSLLTLWYYIRIRESCRPAGFWRWLFATWLFIAALNAKEMAAILPAIFLLYEWFWHSPESLKPASFGKWLWRNGRFSILTLALAALAFWGKRRPGSLLHGEQLYKVTINFRQFFIGERNFISELFYLSKRPGINTTGVVVFYAVLFAIAALTRKKHLWLMAWFALLGPLPVIFIPYRGMAEFYVPFAAFAIYLAALIVFLRDWLLRAVWKQTLAAGRVWVPARIVVFAVVAFLIPFGKNREPLSTLNITDPVVRYVAAFHDSVLRLNEPLPEHARILLLKCEFPDDDWQPLMMMRLLYRDPEIWVDRPAMMKTPPDPAAYDRVIDFDGRNLVTVRRKQQPGWQDRFLNKPSD